MTNTRFKYLSGLIVATLGALALGGGFLASNLLEATGTKGISLSVEGTPFGAAISQEGAALTVSLASVPPTGADADVMGGRLVYDPAKLSLDHDGAVVATNATLVSDISGVQTDASGDETGAYIFLVTKTEAFVEDEEVLTFTFEPVVDEGTAEVGVDILRFQDSSDLSAGASVFFAQKDEDGVSYDPLTLTWDLAESAPDETLPEITITSPLAGASYGALAALEGTAMDDTEVTSLTYSLKQGEKFLASAGGDFVSDTEVAIPLTLTDDAWKIERELANAEYVLRLIAKDAADNTQDTTLGFKVGPQEPLVITPVDGKDSKLLRIYGEVDPTEGGSAEVKYSLKSKKTDKYFDGTAFTLDEEQRNPVTLTDNTWEVADMDIALPVDEEFTLTTYLTEASWVSHGAEVVLENVGPTIELELPEEDASYVDTVTIKGAFKDPDGVKSAQYSLKSGNKYYNFAEAEADRAFDETSQAWYIMWTLGDAPYDTEKTFEFTHSFAPGEYELMISTVDAHEDLKTTTKTIGFTITDEPTHTIDLDDKGLVRSVHGSFVPDADAASVTVQYSLKDNASGKWFDGTAFTKDEEEKLDGTLDQGLNWKADIGYMLPADETLLLTIYVEGGTHYAAWADVLEDGNAPQVIIATPGHNTSMETLTKIAGLAVDAKSAITTLEFSLQKGASYLNEAGSFASSTELRFPLSLDGSVWEKLADLSDEDTYVLRVFAEDAFGNTAIARSRFTIEEQQVVDPSDPSKYFINPDVYVDRSPLSCEPADAFVDTLGHWGQSHIERARLRCMIGGKSSGIFAPNAAVTRAELTKIVIDGFRLKKRAEAQAPQFNDVFVNAWYYEPVAVARLAAIIDGYTDGSFRPNAQINRAEALKIMTEAAVAVDALDGSIRDNFEQWKATFPSYTYVTFEDVMRGDWFAQYVRFGEYNKIISGYRIDGRNLFQPSNAITRAEVVKIMMEIIDVQEAKGDPSPDLSSAAGDLPTPRALIGDTEVFDEDFLTSLDSSEETRLVHLGVRELCVSQELLTGLNSYPVVDLMDAVLFNDYFIKHADDLDGITLELMDIEGFDDREQIQELYALGLYDRVKIIEEAKELADANCPLNSFMENVYTQSLEQAKNEQLAKSRREVNTLLNAIYQYGVDNNGDLTALNLPVEGEGITGCGVDGEKTKLCKMDQECTAALAPLGFDLDPLITGDAYLEGIPQEPFSVETPYSGFSVITYDSGRITVCSNNPYGEVSSTR